MLRNRQRKVKVEFPTMRNLNKILALEVKTLFQCPCMRRSGHLRHATSSPSDHIAYVCNSGRIRIPSSAVSARSISAEKRDLLICARFKLTELFIMSSGGAASSARRTRASSGGQSRFATVHPAKKKTRVLVHINASASEVGYDITRGSLSIAVP